MELHKLPKRTRDVIETVQLGQRLCKALRLKETGETEVLYWFHPSGRPAPPAASLHAINSGLLRPAGDGLFGADTSQSWTAA